MGLGPREDKVFWAEGTAVHREQDKPKWRRAVGDALPSARATGSFGQCGLGDR